VVFFDKGEHVTRSWVREEWIQVFDEDRTFDHPSLQDMDRSRLNDSLAMAKNCLEKTRNQRLAKFSLATLFQGSWGKSPHPNKSPFNPFIGETWESSFIDPSDQFSPIKLPKIPDEEEEGTGDVMCAGPDSPELSIEEADQGPVFHCLMCDENVARTKETISHHLTRHKVTLDDYPRIFVSHREDPDMKMIMEWIKQDEEDSGLVSERQSQVTKETDELVESSPLQPSQDFLQSQREMIVKATFMCDLSDKRTTNKKEIKDRTIRSIPAEDLNIAETSRLCAQQPPALVEQTQPIKEWICTKPQYFTGYSVVIKKKERRVANLELALSNAPAPPRPQERPAQEPVLPSPRTATHKSPACQQNQSKALSSKKDDVSSPSTGLPEQKQRATSSHPSTTNNTNESKDNLKVSHSVEALIHKPQEDRKSLDMVRYKSLNHRYENNKNKNTKEGDAPPTRNEYTSGKEIDNEKKESPPREAIDLSMK